MNFEARIKKQDGKETTEIREAADRFELARIVRKEGDMLISVSELGRRRGETSGWFAKINEKLAGVSLYEKVVFANNLGEMIKAGLPMARALSVFERQTKNAKMKKVVQAISDSINRGESLNAALAKFPDVFSEMFIAMVASGEESGNLPQALKIIGDQYAKTYSLRKKLRGAMIYPSIVLTAMIIIGIILMVYVVPTLLAAFAEMNAQLPMSTRVLIWISTFLSNYFILFAVFVLALIVFFVWFRRTPAGKRFTSKLSIIFPVVGPISQKMNSAVSARSLSSLLSAGVDMVEAIKITQKVVQNVYYKDVFGRAAERVQKGSTISSVFQEEDKLFPVLVGAMAEVGEETGKLSDMLMNVAVYYEDEVDAATKNISSIVEPLLMALVGVGVGFFAISIISPLYSLGQQIQ
jgi:type IV pilus assembly protein PilC